MKIIILTIFLVLSGCATCSDGLDSDIVKYGDAVAMIKYDSCVQRRMAGAASFQQGMSGVANSFNQKSKIYSDQLPRTLNINQY